MGFDTEQFECEISEELICSICAGVLADPLTTHCDHLFCRQCIHDWLQQGNNSCPIDRCHLRMCMLKPAPRAIRNLINRLLIFCEFHPDGCPECMPLEQYTAHVEQCQYNPQRMVKCKVWCKRTMTLRAMKTHNCVNELMDQVTAQQVQLEQLHNERNLLGFALILMLILYICLPITTIISLIQHSFEET